MKLSDLQEQAQKAAYSAGFTPSKILADLNEFVLQASLRIPFEAVRLPNMLAGLTLAGLSFAPDNHNLDSLILTPEQAVELSEELAHAVNSRNPVALLLCINNYMLNGVYANLMNDDQSLAKYASLTVTTLSLFADMHGVEWSDVLELAKNY